MRENYAFKEFKGALSEQYVSQELISKKINLFYYSNATSTSEIDFLLQKDNGVVPLEVKSTINLKSKSLIVYRDKFKPNICLRTSLEEYKEEQWLTNIPLYAIFAFL